MSLLKPFSLGHDDDGSDDDDGGDDDDDGDDWFSVESEWRGQ